MNAAPADLLIPADGTRALPRRLRLGTRRSPLALAQSRWVAQRLVEAQAAIGVVVQVELVEVSTEGDLNGAPLTTLGGTGVFVSALRDAVLTGEVDLAVHSLKDLPTGPAPGLAAPVVPAREDPRDVLVAGQPLAQLPAGARVGTGSPRRAAQLRALGLGLEVVEVRGNVDTRVRMVTDGDLDAVLLAYAGLRRLGRAAEVTEVLDPLLMLPAPGQGALAVECRESDLALRAALEPLQDDDTHTCVQAERALLARLEAGCSAPVGALAEVVEGEDGPELSLRAVVVSVDGATSLRRSVVVPLHPDPGGSVPVAAGITLAEHLLEDGAADLMPIAGPVASSGGDRDPELSEEAAREGDL